MSNDPLMERKAAAFDWLATREHETTVYKDKSAGICPLPRSGGSMRELGSGSSLLEAVEDAMKRSEHR